MRAGCYNSDPTSQIVLFPPTSRVATSLSIIDMVSATQLVTGEPNSTRKIECLFHRAYNGSETVYHNELLWLKLPNPSLHYRRR